MKVLDRDYELFLAMARALNLSRASDALGIQQSGLSKALKRLETRLERPLFIRKKAGLELTPFGASLRESLAALQDHWDQNLREKVSGAGGLQGWYRVGAHASIAVHVVPKFLAGMAESHPGVEFEMSFARSPEITRKVLNHELDLGFAMNPLRFPDLVIKPLFREHVYYWRSTQQREEKGKRIVLYNPEMLQIERVLAKAGAARFIAIPNYEVIAATALSMPCLGILPELVARRFAELKPEGEPFYPAELCLVYRKERFAGSGRKAFIDRVVGSVKA